MKTQILRESEKQELWSLISEVRKTTADHQFALLQDRDAREFGERLHKAQTASNEAFWNLRQFIEVQL